jgi:hypothetical protein
MAPTEKRCREKGGKHKEYGNGRSKHNYRYGLSQRLQSLMLTGVEEKENKVALSLTAEG